MNVSNAPSISKANSNIMEYLYQKMEAKAKTICNTKLLITNIYDIPSLQSNKRGLLSLFSELEDDLKQASFAIKGLLADNKALTIEVDQLKEKQSCLEENSSNYINELTFRNNNLQLENDELKEQITLLTNQSNVNNNNNEKKLGNISEENEGDIKPQAQSVKLKANRLKGSDELGLQNVESIISNIKNNKTKLKDIMNKNGLDKKADSKSIGKKDSNVKSEYSNKKSSSIMRKKGDNSSSSNSIKENKDVVHKDIANAEEYLAQVKSMMNENEEPITEKIPIRMRSCRSRSKSKSKSKERLNKRNEQRSLSTSFVKTSTPLYLNKSIKPNTSFETSLRSYPKRKNTGSKPKFNPYLNPYGKAFSNPNDQSISIKAISR